MKSLDGDDLPVFFEIWGDARNASPTKRTVTLVRSDRDLACELTIPFKRELALLFETDATWQPTFNGRLSECGRDEGQRQRHVDVAQAASLVLAIASASVAKSVMSSPSQRRPRAIAATRFIGRSGNFADRPCLFRYSTK